MKTTINLPDDLVRELKLCALLQGRTLRDIVAEFLRKGLAVSSSPIPQPRETSKVEIGPDGIPTIRCRSEASAKYIGIDALLSLQQQTQTQEDFHRAGLSI
jgi:plasmid stability protein